MPSHVSFQMPMGGWMKWNSKSKLVQDLESMMCTGLLDGKSALEIQMEHPAYQIFNPTNFQTMYLICNRSWVWNLLLLSLSHLHKLFLLILHHLHLSKHIHVWSHKQCSLSMIPVYCCHQWSLSDPSSASMATCCWAPMKTIFIQVVISS